MPARIKGVIMKEINELTQYDNIIFKKFDSDRVERYKIMKKELRKLIGAMSDEELKKMLSIASEEAIEAIERVAEIKLRSYYE